MYSAWAASCCDGSVIEARRPRHDVQRLSRRANASRASTVTKEDVIGLDRSLSACIAGVNPGSRYMRSLHGIGNFYSTSYLEEE